MKKITRLYKIFIYLLKSGAPFSVLRCCIFGFFFSANRNIEYLSQQQDFRNMAKNLDLSNDWFTPNIPTWLSTFDLYKFRDGRKILVLEIGSWEGLSSYFILDNLKNAYITCVDTWEGADEHKLGDANVMGYLENIESKFDKNLEKYNSRLIKNKKSSLKYFSDNTLLKNYYDLIYIDGSHYCDDVIIDAVKGFEMLKVGGVMIFDDYLWQAYEDPIDNPAAAINSFLKLKEGCYKPLFVNYQIGIEKTNDSRIDPKMNFGDLN